MTKKQVAERILEDLIDYDYVMVETEEQRKEAVQIILHRLDDFMLIQGEVIE